MGLCEQFILVAAGLRVGSFDFDTLVDRVILSPKSRQHLEEFGGARGRRHRHSSRQTVDR